MSKQLVLMNGEPARPRRNGLLDERTKEVGRLGVVQARAALAEASRRASERDAERLARRENELTRRAEAARTALARRRGEIPATGAASADAA